MKRNDKPEVDAVVVEYFEDKYQLTLDMLSMDEADRARIDGAWEVIHLLRTMIRK